MTAQNHFYRWNSTAELLTAHGEDAAIYYEWLLKLSAGSRPGEALSGIGVDRVTAPYAGRTGWLPVFHIDSLDALHARAGDVRLIEDNADVTDGAFLIDRQGILVRVTESATHEGSQVERTRLNFDCSTLDVHGTVEFYTNLLGVTPVAVADDPFDMHLLTDDEGVVAGIFKLNGVGQFSTWPIWITYFEVESVDETVTRAVQSGSRIRIPPSDSPFNRYAVLDDPWGNLYGLSAMFPAEQYQDVRVRTADGQERALGSFIGPSAE